MQGAEPHGMPDVPATLERRVAGRPDQEASSPRALLRRRRRLARAALEILLEQMRERVHVTQLAVLDPEQVRVGRAGAAVRAAGAERAEDDDRPGNLVDD